jgi:hypothetical protein
MSAGLTDFNHEKRIPLIASLPLLRKMLARYEHGA